MKEGLYKVDFQVPNDNGTGVGYLKNGKFYGGDSIIYYLGTYTLDGATFKGVVQTNVHSHQAGMGSIFGIDSVNITLSGVVEGDVIHVQGEAKEAPGIPFRAKLTLIAE